MDAFAPPVSTNSPHADAPEISEWTRSSDAGDTFALSGETLSDGLDGADTRFVAYGIGATNDVAIQRLDGQHAALTLSDSLPSDEMYLMWPRNDNGYGEAVAINQTETWWIGPALVSTGETFSIFGRNLDFSGGTNYVWIEEADLWLTNTTVNPYKTDFVVPDGLANGTYTLWAHNGKGQEYGWADSVSLEVVDEMYWDDGTQTVAAVTESALLTAIAASSNHETIIIPAGTYYITADIELRGHDGVWLKGAGVGQTIIEVDPSYVGVKGNACILDCGSQYAGDPNYFDVDNVKISGITFEWGDGTPEPTVGVLMSGSRIWIEDCHFSQINTLSETNCGSSIASFGGTDGPVFVNNCTFMDGKKTQMGSRVFMDGCTFRELHDGGSTSSGYAMTAPGSGISITDTTCQDYDDSDDSAGAGWGGGRFVIGIKKNFYFGGNEAIEYAPRWNWHVGEYGGYYPILSNSVSAATTEATNTITIVGIAAAASQNNVQGTNVVAGDTFFIDYGTGAGSFEYDILSVNRTTELVKTTNTWDVAEPDATSVVRIHVAVDQPHQNGGEQVLSESLKAEYAALVSSTTPSNAVHLTGLTNLVITIVSQNNVTNDVDYSGHSVVIVDGRGFGQLNTIDVHDGGLISFENEWNVEPDTTSVISIGIYVHNIAIHNNIFNGREYSWDGSKARTSASSPVNLYGAAHGIVVADNVASDFDGGYLGFSILLRDDWLVGESVGWVSHAGPHYFNTTVGNTITNVRRAAYLLTMLDSHHAPYATSMALFGNVMRSNYGTNVFEEGVGVFEDYGFTNAMTIIDGNIFSTTNGVYIEDADSVVVVGNNVSGVTTGVFGEVTLHDNTWTGFAGDYFDSYSQLQIPIRVIQTATNVTSGAFTLWNSGTASMDWTANEDSSWITLTTTNGTVADEGATDSMTWTATGTAADATINIVVGGATNSVTVLAP